MATIDPLQSTYGGGALPAAFDPQKLRTDAGTMEKASEYTPDENALVSSQLNRVLATDSPYITRARTKAAEKQNIFFAYNYKYNYWLL